MTRKKKKTLGRGMSELVEGSFSSIVEPAARRELTAKEAPASPAPSEPSRHEAAAAPPVKPRPVSAARPSETGARRRRDSARRARAQAPPRERAAVAPGPVAARPFDVVSISSGKGGTGKSVLTSNLGVLLAGSSRVTILDADLGLANIHILYNLMPRYNASHVISGEQPLDGIMIRGPRGVNVIPGGSGIPELASLTRRMFGSFVDGIAALDRSTDLLLIDTPSGIDAQSLIFLLASDQVLVVTTDDITAMTDAYAVIKTVLTRKPDASVALIVNQARSYADGMDTFQKMAHVARKFLGRELALGGIVPFDETVERSVEARVPVAISHPACPAARAMVSIAGRISAFHRKAPHSGEPFTARLRGLLSENPSRAGMTRA